MSLYVPILALAILAGLFAVFSLVAGSVSGPKRWNRAKLEAYECGIEPTRQPLGVRFPVKYYLTAMLFIVFDIEIIFLFPWAIVFRSLGPFGLFAILIFVAAVFESFVYLIGNGALDWGPIKRLRRVDVVDPNRTSASTIRRVGLEGRDPVPGGPGTREAA